MTRAERIALIEDARAAHEQVGRGIVVKLLEDHAPRFVAIEEAKSRLVAAGADADLLVALLMAVGKYDTKWQAVFLLEYPECTVVEILSHDKIEVIWSASWTLTH